MEIIFDHLRKWRILIRIKFCHRRIDFQIIILRLFLEFNSNHRSMVNDIFSPIFLHQILHRIQRWTNLRAPSHREEVNRVPPVEKKKEEKNDSGWFRIEALTNLRPVRLAEWRRGRYGGSWFTLTHVRDARVGVRCLPLPRPEIYRIENKWIPGIRGSVTRSNVDDRSSLTLRLFLYQSVYFWPHCQDVASCIYAVESFEL